MSEKDYYEPLRNSRITGTQMLLTWLGIIVWTAVTLVLYIVLDNRAFGIQLATSVAYTGVIFFYMFCDSRGVRGYDLRNKKVQGQVPGILAIHCGSLLLLFLVQTYELSLRPQLPDSWLREHGRDPSYFVGLIGLSCFAIAITQILICRRLLKVRTASN
jgi:hypothetical protein